MRLTGHIVAQG